MKKEAGYVNSLKIEGIIALVTNVGFPAALSLMLLKYILVTMSRRLEQLDQSVKRLSRSLGEAEAKRMEQPEEQHAVNTDKLRAE
jgi:ABC-type sulfate transport system permease component